MGRNCYKNNQLYGVFLGVWMVLLYTSSILFQLGGGVMHLVNFPMSFLNPSIIEWQAVSSQT